MDIFCLFISSNSLSFNGVKLNYDSAHQSLRMLISIRKPRVIPLGINESLEVSGD